jgi:hypothetical protein
VSNYDSHRQCGDGQAHAAGTILAVSSPLAQCGEKIINRFLFRPEIAEKFLRIAREMDVLLGYQFIDAWMALPHVFFGY